MRNRKLLALNLLFLILFFSCSSMKTTKSQYINADKFVSENNFTDAAASIESEKESSYKKKDRVLFYLDAGMLNHFSGNYELSNKYLTEAEYAIEELYTKSVSKAATSLLLNDNALEYSGEDYEDIYLNIFKALNYYALGKTDSAFVEIKRVNIKLNLLEDKYKKLADGYSSGENAPEMKTGKTKFHNDALARYLSMLLYRNDKAWDDARLDKEKLDEAFKLQKHIYSFEKPNLDSALDRKTKLNVISFIGNGPDKKANTARITTLENHVVITTQEQNENFKQELTSFDTVFFPGVTAGYNFKFQLPYMEKRGTQVSSIKLIVNNADTYELSKIESIENVAEETFNVKKPIIYLKTITRTITKGIVGGVAANAGADALEDEYGMAGQLGGMFLKLATSAAVDATENADLRISRYFPSDAYISEITLDPGKHDLRIEYYDSKGVLIYTDEKPGIEIKEGKLNLVESFTLK